MVSFAEAAYLSTKLPAMEYARQKIITTLGTKENASREFETAVAVGMMTKERA